MNTINKKEIDKFSKIANEWWNPEGKFKPLHKFNPLRIDYLKKNIIKHFDMKNKKNNKPLNGVSILDIGCGGGLLSEPMFRLGAKVTGIDASEKNIKIAKFHSKKQNLKINYLCTSPDNMKGKEKFDVVLNMEIVEHVDNLDLFLKESSSHLKKNGIMFIATLNKTLKSYVFAIVGAEYILRWLPIGTHEWEKFVTPKYLNNLSKKNNLKEKKVDGMKFDILKNQWMLTEDLSVNYISMFEKT